jgi:hypothetical protein
MSASLHTAPLTVPSEVGNQVEHLLRVVLFTDLRIGTSCHLGYSVGLMTHHQGGRSSMNVEHAHVKGNTGSNSKPGSQARRERL